MIIHFVDLFLVDQFYNSLMELLSASQLISGNACHVPILMVCDLKIVFEFCIAL